MKWIKSFWQILIKSASEPTFYLYILRMKFISSLGFYLFLFLLLTFVDVGIVRFREVPRVTSEITTAIKTNLNELPNDFKLTYKDGTLNFSNPQLPYRIKGINNIDATLTSTQLVVGESNLTLKDVLDTGDFTLTKPQLSGKLQEFLNALPQITNALTLIGIPFWFISLTTTTTLTLVFLSFLTNSIFWILGIRLPFIKTFQLGIHAIAVATLLDVIKFAIYKDVSVSLVIPAYLGIMGLVILTLKTIKPIGK